MLPPGTNISHIDITFLGEEPKIAPWAGKMKANMAKVLDIGEESINIKATTTEGLGPIGKKKGLACQAVATLEVKKINEKRDRSCL
jgi:2-C-methyl-D-erythritol 2,4-cyclodiphosphate synthase